MKVYVVIEKAYEEPKAVAVFKYKSKAEYYWRNKVYHGEILEFDLNEEKEIKKDIFDESRNTYLIERRRK